MAKADAYGLGADRMVAALEPEAPLAWGVAAVEEGKRLREHGVERPVLVFAPPPPGRSAAPVAAGLPVCLSSLEGRRHLDEAVHRTGRAAAFQVEVDTGMG